MTDINAFLTTLPAILGIVGYVIYVILRKSATEDPVIKSIIAKLQYEDPSLFKSLNDLNPSQKDKLLRSDYRLREKITLGDRQILDKALSHQFYTNIFVYSLCGMLLITGILLHLRPAPLAIDNITIQNTDAGNSEMIVDIDPITVTWTSTGADHEVFVVLENIETGKQSKRYRSQASDGKVVLALDIQSNFDKILSNRSPNGANRIRGIIYSGSKSFQSKSFDLRVGVKMICFAQKPNKLVFNSIIDQVIIESFHFAPRVALFAGQGFDNRTIFESKDYSAKPIIVIETPSRFSPSNLLFVVNPREIINERVYRTDITSLREAIMSLKSGP